MTDSKSLRIAAASRAIFSSCVGNLSSLRWSLTLNGSRGGGNSVNADSHPRQNDFQFIPCPPV
jgi:hypothetical protein